MPNHVHLILVPADAFGLQDALGEAHRGLDHNSGKMGQAQLRSQRLAVDNRAWPLILILPYVFELADKESLKGNSR